MAISGISAGLSALDVARTRLANTSHNIANVTNPDARRIETVATSVDGGVRATSRPGDRGIDLAEEAIELRGAEQQAKLAAKVIRAIGDTEQSVLDILA